LPGGSSVAVTSSPRLGIEATLELTEQLESAGFRAIPHLAARMVRDRAHLRDVLARLAAAGGDRAFVVAGDALDRGRYADGLALLREMAEIGQLPSEIGIPCYPQGHAFIADQRLLDALRAKAPFASYMTTQLCFDPAAIASFVAARRAEGIELPVHVGVPGVAKPQRLLSISARIGVRDTRRFVAKNTRFVGRLIRSGGFYSPDALLEDLGPHLSDPAAAIVGLHFYTFNAVRQTEGWRRRYLARFSAAPRATVPEP
ncbi:MAG: 5,10-methylenetetrahydrofolate reductase, partial [Chloroflexota bacterium]